MKPANAASGFAFGALFAGVLASTAGAQGASPAYTPPPAAQSEVAGYAKDGGKNVNMKDGKQKNVIPVSTAEYNPCGWRTWLNNTTISLGMQNVFDEDPPFVAGSGENGYDESLATIKGRFWYVQLKKRF